MQMKSRRSLAVAATASAALMGLGVSGCSDGAEDQAVVEGPETTTTEAGQQLEAPVIVDSADPLTVEVGQVLDVVTDGVTEVETSDAAVLEVTQPNDDGPAQFNAGATAESVGQATLKVRSNAEVLYEVPVTVEKG